MPPEPHPPTDMRAYRRRFERNLVIAVVIALVVVGGLFIGLVYGWPALFTALLCLLPGAAVFLALWLVLLGIEYLANR